MLPGLRDFPQHRWGNANGVPSLQAPSSACRRSLEKMNGDSRAGFHGRASSYDSTCQHRDAERMNVAESCG
ncbi:MAG TPA: hypothetical protein VHE32_04160 [Rhodanobacteraceae bacterium]|nr:hypothetical protein [Rhodanobacteraceae bacterium]